ncbi:MAG: polysaccharide deacetylase family protein, partial [Rhodothermales bacterium]|nr:polysaccharide deacetylase family protein [Rhodothermales bacterium]
LPEAVQRREVSESKRRLEAVLQRPVAAFAYPHGAAAAETVRAVADAGFARAYTTAGTPLRRPVGAHRLPRLVVEDWDGATFERTLTEWFS